MFVKGMTIERLPPTRDALYLHIRRSHYQTLVWRQAHLQYPILPQPEILGWKMEGHYLVPKLTSLPPVPEACQELITCMCSTGCKTARCGCKHNPCTASCKCRKSRDTCMNQYIWTSVQLTTCKVFSHDENWCEFTSRTTKYRAYISAVLCLGLGLGVRVWVWVGLGVVGGGWGGVKKEHTLNNLFLTKHRHLTSCVL